MIDAFGRPTANGIDDVGLVDHLDLKTGGNPRKCYAQLDRVLPYLLYSMKEVALAILSYRALA